MSLKIVFAGTPEFSVAPLQTLLASLHTLLAVYTQPDRPAGRGRQLHASPVKQLALKHNIPVYQPKTLRDPKEQEFLAALKPDVLVVVAYGLILPKAVLDIPKYGCINIHASLLPRWRGASPIQQAILAGDLESGVCIMQMDEGLDTGDVLSIHPYTLAPQETSQSLHDQLSVLGSNGIIETLEAIESNSIVPKKQNNSLATHAPKIRKEEAQIDWSESAVIIDRKIRGYNPWPVAFSTLGEQVIRIWAGLPLNVTSNLKPGSIIEASDEGIDVATGEGVLRIAELQLAGGKRLPVEEILKSKKESFQKGFVFS